jgi:type I restriction enzyme, R subunit
MKFTEEKLETAFTELLGNENFQHQLGITIARAVDEVLIEEDLLHYLLTKYESNHLTRTEAKSIILQLKTLPSSDLYESNKTILRWLSDGFILKREDRSQKDIHIELIDYNGLEAQLASPDLDYISAEQVVKYPPDYNIYKFVNQLEIVGSEKRIPDGIIYINGLPLVVFEFKSAIREEATIFDAYNQLTIRYRRDIPELFKYNVFCVLSDGINNKTGSFFAPYEFFYAWRRVAGLAKDVDGIDSMFTLIQGMFNRNRFRDIIRNFIYFPDSSKKNEKIVCRYPQYYAAKRLFDNIKLAQKPKGDGKGGTYFGATGCGKSFTMLYLTRLLMKSEYFESPTIVLITDRIDLDDQLSEQFTNAKRFIGDNTVLSVESRAELRNLIRGRQSGGVFLTTIHKFTEDTELLSDRNNVICISDEAHRTQVNLDQKIKVTEKGVTKTFGFAKYLHDSLPNATFVGFTGTPIDATLDVFGKVIDAYTMTESVRDEITVRIVYDGRAAKIALNNSELEKIEKYYEQVATEGANEYQIEQSKEETAKMNAILGDPKRLQSLAEDFVTHYENRVSEGATVKGKAMFVCSSREIAYAFYKNVIALRPQWNEIRIADEGEVLSEKDKSEIKPMERIKLIMTRSQDDPEEMYKLIGTKEQRKELDRQYKNEKSNFKIAIIVDMWLTGFDVPFLDTMYIDKPIQQHNLIQTISRVNRKYAGKNKGLVVD